MRSQLVPLVGRDAEMGRLALALDAAAGGEAGVVALVGEAGVGKSRLTEEGMALARARGFLTLHAVASPLHTDLHFGVVVEALRPLVRTVEAGARTRLVEGLPDLGRLFDGLHLPVPAPLGDAGMERMRLFEAVCRLLDRLTRQQPVLLVVDDLQWADPASLAVLHYVVRGLTDCRFLALITRRAGESGGELDGCCRRCAGRGCSPKWRSGFSIRRVSRPSREGCSPMTLLPRLPACWSSGRGASRSSSVRW